MSGTISKQQTRFAPIDFPALGPADGELGLFDAVFEESDTGLLILDIDIGQLVARVSDANLTLCAWLSCASADLYGINIMALADMSMDAHDRHQLQHSLIRHRPVSLPFPLSFNQQKALHCQITIRPVRTVNDSLRMVAVLRRTDESARQELAMACRQRDAAMLIKERMLARISHDLRTPLNGILGFADMMVHVPETSGEKMRSYAKDIASAGRELLMRVEDLLAAAQSTAPNVPRYETSMDVSKMLLERLDRARRRHIDAKIEIKSHLEVGLPLLRADKGEIIRSLDAVIDNAVRASGPASTILLTCRLNGYGGLDLSCEDDGPTIDMKEIDVAVAAAEEDQDVYFTPHIRSVAGLPMAKRLVMRNGGTMHVSPRAHSAGFKCDFSFPADRLEFRI